MKRRAFADPSDGAYEDEFDDPYSDDDGTVQTSSKRTSASRRSTASKRTTRSVPLSELRALPPSSSSSSSSSANAAERPECVLCRFGLFCDINAQAKPDGIARIEGKIRELNQKFLPISNTDILMGDIRVLINTELKSVAEAQYGKTFDDLDAQQVKRHFFECIVEPGLQARYSFDVWNTLFKKGMDTVVKRDEEGEEYLDDRQIAALAKVDALRHASMFPRDPRTSMFIIPGLTSIPRHIAGAPTKQQGNPRTKF